MSSVHIFYNGKIIKIDSVELEKLRPENLPGKGMFETLLSINGKMLFLDDHLKRFKRGLRRCRVVNPLSRKKMIESVKQLEQINHLHHSRIRFAVWQNKKINNTAIVCQPLQLPSQKKYDQGYKICLSEYLKIRHYLSDVKSIKYQQCAAALQSAKKQQCDEAIMLNAKREVAEGATSNLFFIKEQIIMTPPIQSGCLNGVTRQKVLDCIKAEGLRFKVQSIPEEQIFECDEIFCTNSVIGVMPITEVNNRQVGKGRAGMLTRQIMELYQRLILLPVKT